ncbi:N5-carboxyaminoimidazole ribonucleotide synthase [hydrothermal vent metagenome]|uniref:N5-carboxyaminoimidazole ribonucleotide synthase n=1 Tax=hydrothermal vent metagenome TaxID=652676 RepID=A0A3B0Z7D7_9ZZZZ
MIIGILGGGQLARMLALAGHPLGLQFIILDPDKDACAGVVADQIQGNYNDTAKLELLAQKADVVTYEFENVPAAAVEFLVKKVPVHPPQLALITAQDRLSEKKLFRKLDICTPEFVPVNSLEELQSALKEISYPAVIKTLTQGYDGKGQAVLRSKADLTTAWKNLKGVPAIVEAFIPFDREISIIAARSRSGETKCYPVTENVHDAGILRFSKALQNDSAQHQAADYVKRLLNHLDYVGVIALELFQVGNQLLANEFAPRVHNSGHWTQDGAIIDQFENHLRAILDLPLGSTDSSGHAAMINLISTVPSRKKIMEQTHANLHLYGKEERLGRKLGHINICTNDEATFNKEIEALQNIVNL